MYALEVEKTYRIMLPVIFPWYDQEVVPCQQQQQSQWYHVELKVPDHKKKKLEDRAGKKVIWNRITLNSCAQLRPIN